MKKIESKQKISRPPKTNDKGIKGVLGTIRGKEWLIFGIYSWNLAPLSFQLDIGKRIQESIQ